MFILRDKSELIHYLKGSSRSFSRSFLLPIKKEYKKWCSFANHGENVDSNCYVISNNEIGWIQYLEYFVTSIKYLIGDNYEANILDGFVKTMADPYQNSTADEFEKNLDQLISAIKDVEIEINKRLSQLTCLECRRLGESITCLESSCFRSSTVMAASAVEARLHNLINKKNKTIYKKHFQKSPLGGIIKLFDRNEFAGGEFKSLKKIMPDKHKSLLDTINTYRILSAHPKENNVEVDFRIAETVINLSLLFLIDPELRITDKKLLKHKKS